MVCRICATLAREHAFRFGIPPETLIEYWNVFSYDLGESEQKGLKAFYKYAAEIGAIETAPDLEVLEKRKVNVPCPGRGGY